jgi:hypothetical protein
MTEVNIKIVLDGEEAKLFLDGEWAATLHLHSSFPDTINSEVGWLAELAVRRQLTLH